MKNLADFKRALVAAMNAGKTVSMRFESTTTYHIGHPGFSRYPDGKQTKADVYHGCKIGRVQSNSFTRIINEGANAGKESWMDFGKSSDWTFDGNTATNTSGYTSTDHENKTVVSYTFDL